MGLRFLLVSFKFRGCSLWKIMGKTWAYGWRIIGLDILWVIVMDTEVFILTTVSGLFLFQQPIQIDLDTSRYSDTPDFLPIHLSTNRWEGLNCYCQCFFYKESFFMIIIVSITKCSNMSGSYQLSFFGLIQHMQKFQHAHWLRTHQLTTNSAESWNWEPKVEIVTYWQVGWIFIVFCAVRMKRTATR